MCQNKQQVFDYILKTWVLHLACFFFIITDSGKKYSETHSTVRLLHSLYIRYIAPQHSCKCTGLTSDPGKLNFK